MSPRTRLIAALDSSPEVRLGEAEQLLADLLAEVADQVGAHCEEYGVLGVAAVIRRTVTAPGEKDSAITTAPTSTPDPTEADRLTRLRRAVADYQGEWTTCRAQRLYYAVYGPGDWRLTARRDLVTLHKGGLLVLDDTNPSRRFYTLNTWGDAR